MASQKNAQLPVAVALILKPDWPVSCVVMRMSLLRFWNVQLWRQKGAHRNACFFFFKQAPCISTRWWQITALCDTCVIGCVAHPKKHIHRNDLFTFHFQPQSKRNGDCAWCLQAFPCHIPRATTHHGTRPDALLCTAGEMCSCVNSFFEYAGQRPNVLLCNIYKLPPAGFRVEPVCHVTRGRQQRFETNHIVWQFAYKVLDCRQNRWIFKVGSFATSSKVQIEIPI